MRFSGSTVGGVVTSGVPQIMPHIGPSVWPHAGGDMGAEALGMGTHGQVGPMVLGPGI